VILLQSKRTEDMQKHRVEDAIRRHKQVTVFIVDLVRGALPCGVWVRQWQHDGSLLAYLLWSQLSHQVCRESSETTSL
jgi:hypothetical protein